jgi:hypothetical protein
VWTISPSAKSLLIMKSQTSIPFAAEAARVVFGVDGLEAELAVMKREPLSGLRLEHFESRYRSLDTLLADTGLVRVLELAAGLSFRGLELAQRDRRIHYLDTDLPAIAALKTELIAQLHPGPLAGQLEVLSASSAPPNLVGAESDLQVFALGTRYPLWGPYDAVALPPAGAT